jgi:F-type H+-transporting ATPase subunit gamma
MFSRQLRNVVAPALPLQSSKVQARNVGSLKVVKERMRTVASIQKITKAMKMVASAKMRGDKRRMEVGMPFVGPISNLMQRLQNEDKSGPITFMGVTSDKGLCGGVNSAVNKQVKLAILEEEGKGNAVKVMYMGQKGPAGLKRLFGDRFTYSFEELAKTPFNYLCASLIAERINASNPARLSIVSNKFQSMVAYDTAVQSTVTKEEAKTMDRAEFSKAMDVYSFEPALYEVWDDLHEFYYGAAVFGAQINSAVTEQSQRMAAMENASKNAGEMLEKLTLIYNRARQAKITTELCEIISGASAL